MIGVMRAILVIFAAARVDRDREFVMTGVLDREQHATIGFIGKSLQQLAASSFGAHPLQIFNFFPQLLEFEEFLPKRMRRCKHRHQWLECFSWT
jgi:hypothetical protein